METNNNPILDIRQAIAETLVCNLSFLHSRIKPDEVADEIIDRLPDFFRQPLQAAPIEPRWIVNDCRSWDMVYDGETMAACSALTRLCSKFFGCGEHKTTEDFKDDSWLLFRVFTAPEHRDEGLATTLVERICNAADQQHVSIYVDPKPFDYSGEPPLDDEQLRCWYRVQFGFENVTDPEGVEPTMMVRAPRCPLK